MSGEQFTAFGARNPVEAEPFEAGVVQWLRKPGEGGRENLAAGYWYITPEESPTPVVITGDADETIYIIEGRVRLQPEGEPEQELTAGSSASLNRGVPVIWTILEPTVEFFVYS